MCFLYFIRESQIIGTKQSCGSEYLKDLLTHPLVFSKSSSNIVSFLNSSLIVIKGTKAHLLSEPRPYKMISLYLHQSTKYVLRVLLAEACYPFGYESRTSRSSLDFLTHQKILAGLNLVQQP